MRKFVLQIIAVFFLLLIAGNKLVEITQQFCSIEKIESKFLQQKESNKNNSSDFFTDKNVSNFNYLHLNDNSDVTDNDTINTFDFIATCAKIFVFAFFFSLVDTKYKKHRFSYDAFIRLFSQKYIVLRTLRI